MSLTGAQSDMRSFMFQLTAPKNHGKTKTSSYRTRQPIALDTALRQAHNRDGMVLTDWTFASLLSHVYFRGTLRNSVEQSFDVKATPRGKVSTLSIEFDRRCNEKGL